MSDGFRPLTAADVIALIREHPLANVVSRGPDGFMSTPLPLLPVLNESGDLVELLGHFARSNQHVAALERDPQAVILFHGPQGYISPAHVSNKRWAPTWNYAEIEFQAEIRFDARENDHAIAELVHAMEGDGPNAWSTAAMGDRYDQLIPHIVAFRAPVTASRARFKLGQDEDDATFAEIVSGLGDTPLARLMRAQNPGR